jgi:hypothetical protein
MMKSLLNPILDDEGLTRGLGDPEARILIEWLVSRAEIIFQKGAGEVDALGDVQELCRRARALGRFVNLWGQPKGRGAACQLAATARFAWPLPNTDVDPCDLMQSILAWEADHMDALEHRDSR